MNLDQVLQNSQLSLEQRFKLVKDKDVLQKASKEQLIDLYLLVTEQLMLKENLVRELLKANV